MDHEVDRYGVPIVGSHPWRAWWLGCLDRNKRNPRTAQEILEYFGLKEFPLPASEIAKLEARYQEGFWQLVDRAHEPNGPIVRGLK